MLLQKLFPGIAATVSAHSAAYMSSCESHSSSGRDKRRNSPVNTPSKKRSSKILVDKRSPRKSSGNKLRSSGGKSPPRGPVSGDENDLMVTVDISDSDIHMKASPPKESATTDSDAQPVTYQPVSSSIIDHVQAVGMSISSSASSAEITAAVGKSLSAAFTGLKRNFYSIAASSSMDNVESSQPTVATTNTTNKTTPVRRELQQQQQQPILEQPQESFENVNVGVCDVLDEMRFLHTSSDSMDSFASDHSKVSKRSRRSRKKGTTPASSKRLKAAVAVELNNSTIERLPTLMETFSKSPSMQCMESTTQDNIFSDSFMNSDSPYPDGLERLSSSSWAMDQHVRQEYTETADIQVQPDFPIKAAEIPFSRRISKSKWIAMNEVIATNEPANELAVVNADTSVDMEVSDNTETGVHEPHHVNVSPSLQLNDEVEVGGDAVSQPDPSAQLINLRDSSSRSDESNSLITVSAENDRQETDLVSSVSATVDPIILSPSTTSSNQSPSKEIINSESMTLSSHQENSISALLENLGGGDSRESLPVINTQFAEAVDCSIHSKRLSANSLSLAPSPISTKSYSYQAQSMVGVDDEEENSGPVRSDFDDSDDDGDDELSLQSAENSFNQQELIVKRHGNDLDDIKDVLLGSFSTISPQTDTPQCALSSSMFTISPPDGEKEDSSSVAMKEQQPTPKAEFTSLATQVIHTSLMNSDFQYIDLKECVDSEVDSQSQRSISPMSDNLVSSQTEVKVFPPTSEKPSVQFCPDSPSADRPVSSMLPVPHRSNDDFQYFGMMSIQEVAALETKEVLNTTADTVKTAVVSPSDSCNSNSTELSSENQMHLSSQNSFRNDSIFHCVTFSPPATMNEKSKIFTPNMETEFAYWQKGTLEKSGLVEVMFDKNDCFDRSLIRKVSVSSPPTMGENIAEEVFVGIDYNSDVKEVLSVVEDNHKFNQVISVSLSPAVMDVSMSRLGVSVEFSPVKNDVSFYYTVFDPNKFEKSIDEFSVNEMYENTIVEYQSSNDSATVFGFAEIYSASDMSPIIRKYLSSYLAESAVTTEKGMTADHIGFLEADLLGPVHEEAITSKALGNEVDVKQYSMHSSAPLLEPPRTPTAVISSADSRSRKDIEGSVDVVVSSHAHEVIENLTSSVDTVSAPSSPSIGDLKASHTPLYIVSKSEGSVPIGTSVEVTNTSLLISTSDSILGDSHAPNFAVSNITNPVSSNYDSIETSQPLTSVVSDMAEVESTVASSPLDQKVATTTVTSSLAAATGVDHPHIVSVSMVAAPMYSTAVISESSFGEIAELTEKGSVVTINAAAVSSPDQKIAPPAILSSEDASSVCHSPKVSAASISTPRSTSLGILEASPVIFSAFTEEIMGKEDLSVSCINLNESNCLETMEMNIHSNNIAENDILLSFSDENEKMSSCPITEVVDDTATKLSSSRTADTTNATTSNSLVSSSTTKKNSTLDSVSHKRSASSPMKLIKKPKGVDKAHPVNNNNNNYYTISTDVHTTSFNGSTSTAAADTCNELKRVTEIIDLLSTVQAAAITATQSVEYTKSTSTLSTADMSSTTTTTGETSPLEVNTLGANVSVQFHKIESRIFCDQLVEAESASALEQTDGHTQGSIHSGRSSKGNSTGIKKILLPRGGPAVKINHNEDSSARNTLHDKKKPKNSGHYIEVKSANQKHTTMFATKATNTTPSSPSLSSLSTQRTKESSSEGLPMKSLDIEGHIYGQPGAFKTTVAREIMEIKAVGIQTDKVGVESVHTGSTSGRRSSMDSSASGHRQNLASVRKASPDKHRESSFSLRKIAVYICIIIVAVSSVWLQLLPMNETVDQMPAIVGQSSNVTSDAAPPPSSFSSHQSQSAIMYQYVRVITMRYPKVLKRSIVDYSAVSQSPSDTFDFTGDSKTESFSKLEKTGSLPQPKSFLSLKNKRLVHADHGNANNSNTVAEEVELNTVGDGGVLQSSREDITIDDSTSLAAEVESSYPFQIVYSIATGEFVPLEVTSSTDDVNSISTSQEDYSADGDSDTEDDIIVLGGDSLDVSEDNLAMPEPSDLKAVDINHDNMIQLNECVEIFRSQLTAIKLFRCGGEVGSVNKDFKTLVISYSPQFISELIQNLIKGSKTYLNLGHVQFRHALKNIIVHFTGMPDDHAKILLGW